MPGGGLIQPPLIKVFPEGWNQKILLIKVVVRDGFGGVIKIKIFDLTTTEAAKRL